MNGHQSRKIYSKQQTQSKEKLVQGKHLEKQQANGMQKKPVRGHRSSSLSQKLRCKPETVGLNVNVEALASLFTSPTANKRERKWKHEGNTEEKNCK